MKRDEVVARDGLHGGGREIRAVGMVAVQDLAGELGREFGGLLLFLLQGGKRLPLNLGKLLGGEGGVENGVGVGHGGHVERGCRAAPQELVDAEACGGGRAVNVVGVFQRPDARAKPIEEDQVVCEAAEQGLDEMDVGLHKAGHEPLSPAVHFFEPVQFATHRDNAIAGNGDVGVGDGTRLVAYQDACSLEDQRPGSFHRARHTAAMGACRFDPGPAPA